MGSVHRHPRTFVTPEEMSKQCHLRDIKSHKPVIALALPTLPTRK